MTVPTGDGQRGPDGRGQGPAPRVATRAPLRTPSRERWQPLRLGLLNLYRFDHEELAFTDGRLLLRGNNGTGKSRVLALTVPFLLDGETAPHRFEPDGDPAKRIEWNLLLGRHDDRLGYTWLELGRRDGDTDRYVTLGCGMRAVKGRGIAQRWFFVTEQRVGDELFLQAPTGQALTRDRLREALDDRGEVFETATRYRAEVDRRLFGLGEHRYGALVDLLIALRKPQLSRQLDEDALSAALSEALPPLSPQVLGDVAEAFRTLEQDRDDLTAFQAAAVATRSFLDAYGRYAGMAVRRRAQDVTAAHARYESTQRSQREQERLRDVADEQLRATETEQGTTQAAEREAAEQVTTLEASPELRDARDLEHARARAGELAELADGAQQAREVAEQRLGAWRDRLATARETADESRTSVTSAADGAAARADAAALGETHAAALTSLDLPDGVETDVVDGAAAGADTAVARRRDTLDVLDAQAAAVATAEAELVTARREQDRLTGELDHAQDEARAAAEARDQQVSDAVVAYRGWAGAATEVEPDPADQVAWELDTWRDEGGDRSPLDQAVSAAVAAARQRLADARAQLATRHAAVTDERSALAAERDRVASARHLPPPTPHTRDASVREGRAGAPLWQLVEPADGVDPATAAGYEAALEAAGLLDAWVAPDGGLLDADVHDVALVAADAAPAASGGLGAVFVPAPPDDAAVPSAAIAAVLARIGADIDAGEVWVAADGRFRVGPLRGAWRKAAAEHVGHAAREDARQRRLAGLDADLDALVVSLTSLEDEAATLDRRARALDAEADAAPTDGAIRQAQADLSAARRRVADLRARLGDAEREVAARIDARDAARTDLHERGADLSLADRLDDLAGLRAALAGYEVALAALWPTLRRHAEAVDAVTNATTDVDHAEDELRERTHHAKGARQEAERVATRRDTLERTIGASAAEALAHLEAATARRNAARTRLGELVDARTELLSDVKAAAARIDELEHRLVEEADHRQAAVQRLTSAIDAGLLPVASADLADLDDDESTTWSPDRAVRSARRMDQALTDVDAADAAWQQVQQSIHGHYSDLEHALLAHDLRPAATFSDELFVVTADFGGTTRTMPALRDLLDDEVTSRQALLSAREKEILETHLMGDVAAELHALLRAGEQWVADVNRELEAMPTATGMRLRFAWRPRDDGPVGLRQARDRLRSHHAGWTPDQRAELGAFLQEQIARVRDADDAGTWQQHLAAALDYRAWHLFTIERHQDGEWKRLTRRTHGTGSGGEKALALTVPQFAAAAAHYRSAGAHAPRLIALDEAFVGIDSEMRAKCLGLLEQFDLDLVMTSEREWGCYPTVPGLAIAQLATRPGIDAVGISRWVWNGRDRLADDRTAAPAAPRTDG